MWLWHGHVWSGQVSDVPSLAWSVIGQLYHRSTLMRLWYGRACIWPSGRRVLSGLVSQLYHRSTLHHRSTLMWLWYGRA